MIRRLPTTVLSLFIQILIVIGTSSQALSLNLVRLDDPLILVQRISDHYGVEYAVKDKACEFTVAVQGLCKLSIRDNLDQAGLAVVSQTLADLSITKERDVCGKYGITIGHQGDVTTEDGYTPVSPSKYRIRVRNPKLSELYALEYALEHSSPSQFLKGDKNKAIRFIFLAEARSSDAIAEWGFHHDNQPAIFIEPYAHEHSHIVSLEEALIHELAHNTEFAMGWNPCQPTSWKFAQRLGWRAFSNPDTGEQGWSIRSTESASHYYKFASQLGLWVRCDKNGHPVNSHGTRVKRQADARLLSIAQMAKCAQVAPSTLYFPDPLEMFAEALRLYRQNKVSRALLMTNNASLYALVREQDQWEIDHAYGSQQYLRSPEGLLVGHNSATKADIVAFESAVQELAARQENPEKLADSKWVLAHNRE